MSAFNSALPDAPRQRLIDLPDHLRAYHGWQEEAILFHDGVWRHTHDAEHLAGEADHPVED